MAGAVRIDDYASAFGHFSFTYPMRLAFCCWPLAFDFSELRREYHFTCQVIYNNQFNELNFIS
jgi:hypothetical protein